MIYSRSVICAYFKYGRSFSIFYFLIIFFSVSRMRKHLETPSMAAFLRLNSVWFLFGWNRESRINDMDGSLRTHLSGYMQASHIQCNSPSGFELPYRNTVCPSHESFLIPKRLDPFTNLLLVPNLSKRRRHEWHSRGAPARRTQLMHREKKAFSLFSDACFRLKDRRWEFSNTPQRLKAFARHFTVVCRGDPVDNIEFSGQCLYT